MTSSPRSGSQECVLVIEDDSSLRLSLKTALRSAGYKVETAATGPEGLDAFKDGVPDLVLLDVMLPGLNGFEVCREIRKKYKDIPILMVTAKGEEEDIVRGLNLGADDYIVKPFGVAVLLARVDAALRRHRKQAQAIEIVAYADIEINFRAHQVIKQGASVEMTALEMKLLHFFLLHEGDLLPRQRILDNVWGADYYGTDRTVDNFVNRLRTKLEDDPKKPKYFKTIRGAGYRFRRTPSVGDGEE
jgi:two-component system, OmpR family, alkaline phosphatase synthesis response regulator PhoP